ncbi:MAG TPA: hypothetical protein VIM16_22170 [Mucilaginibacter sp.]|jgi:hypothetical protein
MITKPDVTEQQQNKFKEELDKIVKQAPEEVQKLWNDNNVITWISNIPTIHGNVHLHLKGKLQDQFISLMNKLKGRRL